MKGLGQDFNRLWTAYAVSAAGSAVATDAFVLIAVFALHSSPFQVSLLAALSGAIGAFLALPLGPWIEYLRKRPMMVAADVMRCVVLTTVPLAFLADRLTFLHLAAASVIVGVGQIAFLSASGAYLKSLVAREHLTEANGRFESVQWTCSALGPPAGGLLVSVFGLAATFFADAASYLLSALSIRSIAVPEPDPPGRPPERRWWRGMGAGWRHIWSDGGLRLLFANTVTVGALITAMAPILAVMMLQELRFTPFQYGLSVGIPCVAGVVGARLSRRIVARHGHRGALLSAGVARVLWLPMIPLVGPGWLGLAAVTAIHTGTVFSMGVFNPAFAAYRLEKTPHHKVARVLTSWSIAGNAARAACTLLCGFLATLTSPRAVMAAGGLLLLVSCAWLPWKRVAAPADLTRDPA
ncbi:MAG TPA: MFS transporter [Nonomuraea sp.]|nr:MFS transporter [Nonomuraea sp.]